MRIKTRFFHTAKALAACVGEPLDDAGVLAWLMAEMPRRWEFRLADNPIVREWADERGVPAESVAHQGVAVVRRSGRVVGLAYVRLLGGMPLAEYVATATDEAARLDGLVGDVECVDLSDVAALTYDGVAEEAYRRMTT